MDLSFTYNTDPFKENKQYFPTPLQEFIFFDKYSRWNSWEGRRETWPETVRRSTDFLYELSGHQLTEDEYEMIFNAILNMDVLPSMRLMAMAGPAARRDNSVIYNCSYLPIDSLDSFVEVLLLSMSGVGIGYSVEQKYINELPPVNIRTGVIKPTFVVEDSQEGWGNALRVGLYEWFAGNDIKFDYSQIRPSGTPLKTKGGVASGGEVLEELMSFIEGMVFARQGSRLSPLDAHDIVTKIGDAVVSGGVRRTAYLSMFDWNDDDMLRCKNIDEVNGNYHRYNANNSFVIDERKPQQFWLNYFYGLFKHGTGEPGFVSRYAMAAKLPIRRDSRDDFGVNACSEITLRPYQFCNLTTIVARPDDTIRDLLHKAYIATLIGTIQSMATHFPYLRDEWKKNAEEERLLGVSITGITDNKVLTYPDQFTLTEIKMHVVMTNKRLADRFGINESTASTSIKPSGNSSQLVNASSGIHFRWSPYYIRRVRVNVNSPVYHVLTDAGVPSSPEVGQTQENARTYVFEFPIMSPRRETLKNVSALQQLHLWKVYNSEYTEHSVSATITYRPDEMLDIAMFMYDNQNIATGLSFLPAQNEHYELAPYEEITEEEYNRMVEDFPTIDWSKLYLYEATDTTNAAQELACTAGVCEI